MEARQCQNMCGILMSTNRCKGTYVTSAWWSPMRYDMSNVVAAAHYKRTENLGARTYVTR